MSQIPLLLSTGGTIHDYKAVGAEIRQALEATGQFAITHVENSLYLFVTPNLDPYDVIVFFFTLGTLTDLQKNGLLNAIAGGKGFVAVHSGADSFRDCPEYRAMVGGHFRTHPHYRDYQVSIADLEHPITEGLVEFMVKDEQYILDYDSRVHLLASALYQGKAVPVSWTKPWGLGRIFYLALGHDAPACQNPNFQLLLQRGTLWAATKPPEAK